MSGLQRSAHYLRVLEQYARRPAFYPPKGKGKIVNQPPSFARGVSHPASIKNTAQDPTVPIIPPLRIVTSQGATRRLLGVITAVKYFSSFAAFEEALNELTRHWGERRAPSQPAQGLSLQYNQAELLHLWEAMRLIRGNVAGQCFNFIQPPIATREEEQALIEQWTLVYRTLYRGISYPSTGSINGLFHAINQQLAGSALLDKATPEQKAAAEELAKKELRTIDAEAGILTPEKMPLAFFNRVLLHVMFPEICPLPSQAITYIEGIQFDPAMPRLDYIICCALQNWLDQPK